MRTFLFEKTDVMREVFSGRPAAVTYQRKSSAAPETIIDSTVGQRVCMLIGMMGGDVQQYLQVFGRSIVCRWEIEISI